MDLLKPIQEAAASFSLWLSDRDRFFLYGCVLGWVSNVLLTYSLVMLLRVALCGAIDCAGSNEALLTISSLAWQGTYVTWGIVFALLCGWNTSRGIRFRRYYGAAFHGVLVCGAASTIITWRLGLPGDIMDRWYLGLLFVSLGPALFAAIAKLSNMVRWQEVSAITSGAFFLLGAITYVGAGVKFFLEISSKLASLSP